MKNIIALLLKNYLKKKETTHTHSPNLKPYNYNENNSFQGINQIREHSLNTLGEGVCEDLHELSYKKIRTPQFFFQESFFHAPFSILLKVLKIL